MRWAVLVVALTSCETSATSPTPVDGAASMARTLFEAQVYPILTTRCDSCHDIGLNSGLGFVETRSPSAGYDAIVMSAVVGDFTVDAPIVRQVDSAGHPGGSYLATELSAVEAWLTAEHSERGL